MEFLYIDFFSKFGHVLCFIIKRVFNHNLIFNRILLLIPTDFDNVFATTFLSVKKKHPIRIYPVLGQANSLTLVILKDKTLVGFALKQHISKQRLALKTPGMELNIYVA